MIGYVVTFGVMGALGAACWAFAHIARQAERPSEEGDAMWPHNDSGWR